MNYRRVLIPMLSLALAGCSAPGVSYGGAPLTGAWGGIHASLALTGEGGTITYDCAHGALHSPLTPKSDGTFDVPGVHVREHGGPVRTDEVLDSVPARFMGQVHNDRMTLRVIAGADTLGPFDLQLGAAPQLFRCL